MMLALPEPRIATIKRLFLRRNRHQPVFKFLLKKQEATIKKLKEKESFFEKDIDEIALI